MTKKAFISYSHEDEPMLDSLHKHMAVLQREGALSTWHDRNILVGDYLDPEIEKNLRESDLFIALVSPSFLASEYCFERKLQLAFQLSDENKLALVAVIIEFCDWLNTPLARAKVAPKDGQPISAWPNENEAFLDVITEVRRLLKRQKAVVSASSKSNQITATKPKSGSRLRIKRKFDEVDRQKFKQDAFEEIKSNFRDFAEELNKSDDIKVSFTEESAHSFSCTVVNKANNDATSFIRIRSSHGVGSIGEISFVRDPAAQPTTSNGAVTVETDEYQMFLQFLFAPMSFTQDREALLTPDDVAEVLWQELIRDAGIEYA